MSREAHVRFCESAGVKSPRATRLLLFGERHLRRVLREYVTYYNESRPHQGIDQAIPKGTANDNVVAIGDVVARPILGGLHHDYRRAASR